MKAKTYTGRNMNPKLCHNILRDGSGIPGVNSGGCGYFAYHLWKHLDKKGVQADICALADLKMVKTYLSNKLTGFGHVVVRINGVLYDGKGTFVQDDNDVRSLIKIKPEYLKRIINRDYLWNDTFHYMNNGSSQAKKTVKSYLKFIFSKQHLSSYGTEID